MGLDWSSGEAQLMAESQLVLLFDELRRSLDIPANDCDRFEKLIGGLGVDDPVVTLLGFSDVPAIKHDHLNTDSDSLTLGAMQAHV
ncbi:hypothetical protein Ciccas_007751 [Cichlidogyrus casuarinus]|uniref:Uncharacterized protein n=1 Tax=Cichlidogyrus casuarinus TaxID=1844966 RepID=A0ABD2Q207_9PLAT